jgi:prepilin-type processing-associated H-X9-DG protein
MNGKKMYLVTSDTPVITTPAHERVFKYPADILELPEDALVTNQKAMDDLAAESKDEGIEAAWDLAREVYRMRYDTADQLKAMYGAHDATHVFGMPYEEVVKNREHWAENLRVGDIVSCEYYNCDDQIQGHAQGVITAIDEDGSCTVLFADGHFDVFEGYELTKLPETPVGMHYIYEKLKGEE